MYFPIMYARQSELSALEDVRHKLETGQRVSPILIPMSEPGSQGEAELIRKSEMLHRSGIPFGLVVNPHAGKAKGKEKHLIDKIVNGALEHRANFLPVFQMHSGTTVREVGTFLRQIGDRKFAFYHFRRPTAWAAIAERYEGNPNLDLNLFFTELPLSYRRAFSGRQALVEDPFIRQERNADYPPEDFFSDALWTHEARGYAGFGDYQIVGHRVSEGGAAALAAAIHLTYVAEPEDMRVRHFISDDNDTTFDPGGKYLQALTKLDRWVRESGVDFSYSTAVRDFHSHLVGERFPGFGGVKQISIRHHLETMDYYLRPAD
jgi:hypothetical protein